MGRYSIGFTPLDEFYNATYIYGMARVKKKPTIKYDRMVFTLEKFREYLDWRYNSDAIEEQLEWFNIKEDC